MPQNKPAQRVRLASALPPKGSQLSHREAARMLADVEQARLAEIDGYWALCASDPRRAAQAAGAAPVLRDLHALARNAVAPPQPGAIQYLSTVTARLLHVDAVCEALPEDIVDPTQGNAADIFWEAGMVVALKMAGDGAVLVVRYDGPLFNPGTVPAHELTADENGFVICHSARDGTGADYEYLVAYVMGCVIDAAQWNNVQIDFQSRNDLLRDLTAMEALVVRGRLADLYFDLQPLPTFPTSYDLLIAHLKAHTVALRPDGAVPPAQQATVDGRTGPIDVA